MKIREIMTQNVLSINAGASIMEAARKMKQAEIGVLPVCESGQLVGIITDHDVVVRGLASGVDLQHEIVSNIMSLPAVTIGAEAAVETGAELMRERSVHKLIVVDEAGAIVGILTARDMAAKEPREFTGEFDSEGVLEGIREEKKVA